MKIENVDTVEKSMSLTNIPKQQCAPNHALCDSIQETINLIKIKTIEYLGKEDVYNMEVENHHNFSVNGGLIVHNSIDATRYALNDECINFREEQTKTVKKKDDFHDARLPKQESLNVDNSFLNYGVGR